MTSSRRAVFFAFFLVPSAVVFGMACGQGSSMPPMVTYVAPDSGPPRIDSGHMDTSAPDTTDTAPPDTNPADTFEAAVDACESSQGDGGEVIVSPSSIQFGNMGFVPCGTQAAPQVISITNPTCSPFNWMGAVSGMGGYMLSPSSGMMLMPGVTQMVQVLPAPMPQISAVTPDLYEGSVVITTTAPNDTGHIIQLHETAFGVILVSTLGGSFGFGGDPIGHIATNQYSITNNGNAPTTVQVSFGSSYFGFPPSLPTASVGPMTASYPLGANQSQAPNLAFLPTGVQMYTDTIVTTVPPMTPLCGLLPPNTLVTGSGTAGVGVAPTTLDFGKVPCQTAPAPPQSFTLTNTGPGLNYTMTFALGANSPYTLADSMGAMLSPGIPIALGAASAATIKVVPNAIPFPASTAADAYADTLTITTNATGDVPHVVGLHQTAQGIIYTLGPATVSRAGPPATVITQPFTVGNSGNVAAGYTLTFAPATGQVSILSPPNMDVPSATGVSQGPTLALTVQGNVSTGAVTYCDPAMTPGCTVTAGGNTTSTTGILSPGVTEMGTLSILPPLFPPTGAPCGGEAGSTCPPELGCNMAAGMCNKGGQTLSAIHLTPSQPDGGTVVLCADVPPDIQLQVTTN